VTATDLAGAPDDLRARQFAAIDDSGWGVPFRLVQPRNAMFWVYLWAVAVGIGHTVRFYRQDVGNFGGALIGGGVAFGLYTLVWLAFLGAVNRYTREAPKLLATAFAWGFFAATAALALTVNGAVLSLYAKTFGQAWASDWSPAFTAPFTEEASKALGFLVMLGLAPRLIRSAYDAFIVGAFIGLGFQVWENVLYVYQGAQSDFGTNEPALSIQVIALRSISGLASHALFSAVFCTGLFWVLGWGAERRQLGRGLGLMVLAMVCHGVWDSTAAIGASLFGSGAGTGLLMPIFLIVEILIVLWVARLASSTERAWMHDLLAPEVANGTLTAEEVGAVASSRHHQRRYVKTLRGLHERRTAKHVLTAAHDLAEAIAGAHGAESDDVTFARSEVARLRSLERTSVR
jgi:RsiW-degrading membrane proteinase PrsW (M82 family)